MHGTAFHGDGRNELRGQGKVFSLSPEEEARLLRDYPERFEAVAVEPAPAPEPEADPKRLAHAPNKRLRHAEDK
jgi:hypothetical protein